MKKTFAAIFIGLILSVALLSVFTLVVIKPAILIFICIISLAGVYSWSLKTLGLSDHDQF